MKSLYECPASGVNFRGMASGFKRLKQFLFGRPLPSERLEHERLNKKTALAVLSSDAISSVAYATDQILIVLAVLGTAAAVHYSVPISAAIGRPLLLLGLFSPHTGFSFPPYGGPPPPAQKKTRDRTGAAP